MEKNSVNFLDLLQLLFIALKLCGVINWSWFVVLLPLIISFILAVVIAVLKEVKKEA